MESIVQDFDTSSQLVSVDMSSIKSHYAAGVGLPSPAMGLSDTQICEVASKVGRDPSNRIFSLSEYNPAIEKYRTGALLQMIFSSFACGFAEGYAV